MAGKIIVITGANGGLGRALAKRLAADGEKVVLLGRSLAKVQEVADAIGENALAIACDLMSPDSIKTAFAQVAAVYPKIDVLINNAAIFHPFLIEEASDEQIMNSILTNLAGPIYCCRSAIPMLDPGGMIINLSSESVELPFAHLLLYQSTKAGLERFGKGLHLELEEKGIRVTTVRAGQMTGEGMSASIDPEAGMRFYQACLKQGVNLGVRGTTQYGSVTGLFRYLIDQPADMHVDITTYNWRKPD